MNFIYKYLLMIILVIYSLSGCAGPRPVTQITYPDIEVMSDEEFLDMVQERAFMFFWHETNPETGLVKDRADNYKFVDNRKIASVASVGYGLTAICIAESRGWVSRRAAYERVLKTLEYFRDEMVTNHGFYFHFVHMDTGQPLANSEGSSVDTALFLAGALTAGKYFEGTEVERIANELYERTDWQWMLNNGSTLSMGWDRHGNFLMPRWNQYNEGILCYLLAIGSDSYPIPASSWDELIRPVRSYKDYTCIAVSPLFTHQYPQHWVDMRYIHDGYANYFENSKIATLANRQFCIDKQKNYRTYGPDSWGLTACDGPRGYKVYGGPPTVGGSPVHDGTVAPTGPAGSMQFTPRESLSALRHMYAQHKNMIWGKYGFTDAYNLERNYRAQDVIGIDQGALIVGIENARTGMVWEYFMKNDCINRSLKKIGFKPGVIMPEMVCPETVYASKAHQVIDIDGKLDEWQEAAVLELIPRKHLEFGNLTNREEDLLLECSFMWDDKYLYAAFIVTDNQLLTPYKNHMIHRNDAIELFLDPEYNGLIWNNPLDFQIGMTPKGEGGQPQVWAWFQRTPVEDNILISASQTQTGYIIEAAISWDFLKVKPEEGLVMGISPAVHDLDDKDGSAQAKLNWYFINQPGGCQLGTLKLQNAQK